ncbi:SURF1 family protein [Uliginosibacterium sp. H1]|uniref:SURF1 family protein n=1 Tax=Uliginosibacterium sp. H1 TaxID=3114757 RepID=UPI002E19A7BA|nr:SURF1 family protein [Uliginosibacterium sp. H1]
MTTTSPVTDPREDTRRRPLAWAALLLTGLFAFATFVALGMWQLDRLAWKTDLIGRIAEHQKAAPIAAPGPADWEVQADADAEYRRVTLRGRFANDRETLVQASTALGTGYWVLTPLQTEQGYWVIVNRGFVPADKRDPAQRDQPAPEGVQTVSGLLRLSEPKGRLLQDNAPTENRWYSRDVEAIAQARGLGGGTQPGAGASSIAPSIAPYFVDATADNDAPLGWPRAGLTVLHFNNSHLGYALTWFVLAAMTAVALAYAVAIEHRAQRRRAAASLATERS